MVYIVTGPIDSGKTAYLRQLYRNTGVGDGFILTKQFANGCYVGQRLERVGTGEGCDFSRKGHLPAGWNEALKYKDFSFSRKGLEFAYQIIGEAIEKSSSPIFIDEIGPLELSGKCFCNLMYLALAVKADKFITVRESCLQQVINQYSLDRNKLVVLRNG